MASRRPRRWREGAFVGILAVSIVWFSRGGGTSGASTPLVSSLARPANIAALVSPALAGEGVWHPAGRLVAGRVAVYTTTLRLQSDRATRAGVAWIDTSLLHARLYSGSLSPGGVSWRLSAPISGPATRTLVAAFAGGFLLKDSRGGYFSEGRLVAPLRSGAASLVIYRDGRAIVAQWGRDASMTSSVVAVRQNLTLLVDHGRSVPGLLASDVHTWGLSLHLKPSTWRSGLGVTADGALVYVAGPMTIVDLAQILVHAGAERAMVLDMNPLWPVFATFRPALPHAPARPSNGVDLLPTMIQTPARFFEPNYARDFVTMSTS